MSDLLVGLNPEQAEAVQTTEGPMLILAGAGSGKTRVLTRRVGYLLESGVRPWNIFAVTFTNKAAGEMKERVRQLVGATADDVWVSTFHSSCVRILRRDIEPLGFGKNFAIWDDDDQMRVLKQLLAEQGIDPKRTPAANFRSQIDRAKNRMIGPKEVASALKEAGPLSGWSDKLPAVFGAYEARLKKANALDFNDLIGKVVELWSQFPEVLKKWTDKFHYLMVDEYQDTNAAQYKLIRLLASARSNLAVVGDDDQSIYSFRGADIRNILDFEKDFPEAKIIRLEQNYRSTALILRAASGVVVNNLGRKDKTLRTDAPEGEPLRLIHAPDELAEADMVLSEIRRLTGQNRGAGPAMPIRPGDIAIIYRTNAQSRPFERVLTDARIPFTLVGGKKFYERREVRDILAYLRVVLNPADDMSLLRIINVPTRGLGEKAVESLRSEAARHGVSVYRAARMAGSDGRAGKGLAAFAQVIDSVSSAVLTMSPGGLVLHTAKVTGYLSDLEAENTDESRGRIENIQELARAVSESAREYDDQHADAPDPYERLASFLDRAALSGQSDELPSEGGKVTLLTVHLAKGLEYPAVFVVGLTEGCFPHARSESESEIEEERRLAYVAFTRARERLILTAPRMRRGLDGNIFPAALSRFLMEIPKEAFGPNPPASLFPAAQPSARPARFGVDPAARPTFSAAPPTRMGRPLAVPTPSRGTLITGSPPTVPPDRRRMTPDSTDDFKPGTEVFHPLLGAGTVSSRDGIPSNPRLTIHFNKHGPRTVFAVSARMDILLP
ncbi:MAG: ATP-dependent DNA helicase PcrA [Myxococcales bacterium]|nr:ATP-dependent DNA helicase PcrA [Myxococcales bacterium]